MNRLLIVAVIVGGLMFARVASAQHPSMPPVMTHEEHLAQMQKDAELKRRGAEAMGFDPDKTSHHFRLTVDGGVISVVASSTADSTSRDQIREHLKAIAVAFARGDFGKPTATHAEVPPGVETLRRSKTAIRYAFEQLPAGGSVHITTADPSALAAIHEFLRYQIKEHATGDPLSVQP
jgi:hypothetical protein